MNIIFTFLSLEKMKHAKCQTCCCLYVLCLSVTLSGVFHRRTSATLAMKLFHLTYTCVRRYKLLGTVINFWKWNGARSISTWSVYRRIYVRFSLKTGKPFAVTLLICYIRACDGYRLREIVNKFRKQNSGLLK